VNVMRLARNTSTVAVASIAAWSSWSHMVHVALRFGERAEVAYVLPLSVDGMLIVASTVMVDDQRHGGRVRWSARIAFIAGVAASVAANIAAAAPTVGARIVAAWPAVALLLVVEMLARTQTSTEGFANSPSSVASLHSTRRSSADGPRTAADDSDGALAARKARPRRSAVETAEAIASLRAERPDATTADIANALGVSDRHVRRVLTAQAAGGA
jgi:hypothetical protein